MSFLDTGPTKKGMMNLDTSRPPKKSNQPTPDAKHDELVLVRGQPRVVSFQAIHMDGDAAMWQTEEMTKHGWKGLHPRATHPHSFEGDLNSSEIHLQNESKAPSNPRGCSGGSLHSRGCCLGAPPLGSGNSMRLVV